MNNFTHYGVYLIGIAQIIFGAVGLLTGWVHPADALLVLSLGLSVFGIHNSNVVAAGTHRY